MGSKWSRSYVIHSFYTLGPLPPALCHPSLPAPSGPLFCLFLSAEFLFLWIGCSLYFWPCFQRLQGPHHNHKKKAFRRSMLFTLFTLVLSPSCSYPLLALVSPPPARRVCGLRLFAACTFKQWQEALLLLKVRNWERERRVRRRKRKRLDEKTKAERKNKKNMVLTRKRK